MASVGSSSLVPLVWIKFTYIGILNPFDNSSSIVKVYKSNSIFEVSFCSKLLICLYDKVIFVGIFSSSSFLSVSSCLSVLGWIIVGIFVGVSVLSTLDVSFLVSFSFSFSFSVSVFCSFSFSVSLF